MNLSYNKKIIKTAAFLIFSLSGILFILVTGSMGKQNESINIQKKAEFCEVRKDDFPLKKEEKAIKNQITSDFVIKEYNGNVAVFENGNKAPIRTTDTTIDDLPEIDRELLRKGINVGSEEELSRILEDYCS